MGGLGGALTWRRRVFTVCLATTRQNLVSGNTRRTVRQQTIEPKKSFHICSMLNHVDFWIGMADTADFCSKHEFFSVKSNFIPTNISTPSTYVQPTKENW
jgi:hypothetical protein